MISPRFRAWGRGGGAPAEEFTISAVELILHAAARDTNPKRKRGRQTIASFTLRVSMGCLISGSAKYNRLARVFPMSGKSREPGAVLVTPCFSGLRRSVQKSLPQVPPDFSRVFDYFAPQSRQNHDFYPTGPLCGGFIAM
jgi:hypothetical protein